MSERLLAMWHWNAQFLAELISIGGRLVIVGGVAVHHYIPHREANDLDILVDATESNAQLIMNALSSCDVKYQMDPRELAKPNVQWPVKGVLDLDILTPKPWMNFDHIWRDATTALIEHAWPRPHVRVAAVSTLIEMKRDSDDAKHVADVAMLQAFLDRLAASSTPS